MKRLLVVAALLVGCKQSNQEAWRIICNASIECCSTMAANSPERATAAASWMRDHVSNKEAIKQLESLGAIEGDKTEIVRAMVNEAGLDPADCGMLKVAPATHSP